MNRKARKYERGRRKQHRRSLTKEEKLTVDGLFLEELAKEMYNMLIPGESIMAVAAHFDDKISKSDYICYPVSIELEDFACNYSPNINTKLDSDSTISYTFQIMQHKFDTEPLPLKCAYSKSLCGKYGELLKVVNTATIKAIESCGPNIPLLTPSNIIHEILDGFIAKTTDDYVVKGIKSVMNLYGINLTNSEKIIINTPHKVPQELRNKTLGNMESGELYYIDVYGTNSSFHDVAREYPHFPTMFVLPDYSSLKREHKKRMQSIKKQHIVMRCYNFICKNYKIGQVFSLRDLNTRYKEAHKKVFPIGALHPLHSQDLVRGYPAMFVQYDYDNKVKKIKELQKKKDKLPPSETKDIKDQIKQIQKSDSVTIHFGHSILITDTGVKYIC